LIITLEELEDGNFWDAILMDFLELSAAKYSGVISSSKSCFLPSNKFSLIKTSLLLLSLQRIIFKS
jgi:hypothetical protein